MAAEIIEAEPLPAEPLPAEPLAGRAVHGGTAARRTNAGRTNARAEPAVGHVARRTGSPRRAASALADAGTHPDVGARTALRADTVAGSLNPPATASLPPRSLHRTGPPHRLRLAPRLSPALVPAPTSCSGARDAATCSLLVLRGQKRNVKYDIFEGLNFIGRADEKPVDIDLEDQEPPDRVTENVRGNMPASASRTMNCPSKT